MYPLCIAAHAKHIPNYGDGTASAGSYVTGDEQIWLVLRLTDLGSPLENCEMLRRLILLVPLMIMLSLGGCFFFPRGGGWHDRQDDGGRVYERR